MKNIYSPTAVKNAILLVIVIGFTALSSACAVRDENGNIVSDRECRGVESLGSKIRRSVCMSKEEWAVVDEREAERREIAGERTDDFLRESLNQAATIQGRGFDTPGPQ